MEGKTQNRLSTPGPRQPSEPVHERLSVSAVVGAADAEVAQTGFAHNWQHQQQDQHGLLVSDQGVSDPAPLEQSQSSLSSAAQTQLVCSGIAMCRSGLERLWSSELTPVSPNSACK